MNRYRGILAVFLTQMLSENKIDEFINFFVSDKDKFMLVNEDIQKMIQNIYQKCPINLNRVDHKIMFQN